MAGAGDGGGMECIPRLLPRAVELLEKAAGVGEELAGLPIDLHGGEGRLPDELGHVNFGIEVDGEVGADPGGFGLFQPWIV